MRALKDSQVARTHQEHFITTPQVGRFHMLFPRPKDGENASALDGRLVRWDTVTGELLEFDIKTLKPKEHD